MSDLDKILRSQEQPTVHLISVPAASRSYLGGDPRLPRGVPWPTRNARNLGFLARISLEELQSVHGIDWLPKTGALLFFCELEGPAWGYDPGHRGNWSVLHLPDLGSPVSEGGVNHRKGGLPFINIGFRLVQVLPTTQRANLSLSADDEDAYYMHLESRHGNLPKHQISGFPYAFQSDIMELECQLVTHGLYCGDATGYNDPRAEGLKSGSENWRLLLQLDSDDRDLDLMFWDGGILYFWVRAEEAAAGNFDNVWLIIECC